MDIDKDSTGCSVDASGGITCGTIAFTEYKWKPYDVVISGENGGPAEVMRVTTDGTITLAPGYTCEDALRASVGIHPDPTIVVGESVEIEFDRKTPENEITIGYESSAMLLFMFLSWSVVMACVVMIWRSR